MIAPTDLRTVAELLRDSALAMVMRYAHLAPDHRLAAVERMDVAFVAESTATRTATKDTNDSAVWTDAVQ